MPGDPPPVDAHEIFGTAWSAATGLKACRSRAPSPRPSGAKRS